MIENEKILTGYNHDVMSRLLAYAKPHRIALGIALTALIIASAGQLSLPVIIQRAVDRHMISNYTEIHPATAENTDETVQRYYLEILDKAIEAGDNRYIPREELRLIPGAVIEELTGIGIIGRSGFQLYEHEDFPQDTLGDMEIHAMSREHIVVSSDLLRETDEEVLRRIRQSNIRDLHQSSMIFLMVLLAVLISTFLQVYLMTYTGQRIMRSLRMHLFSHTVRQSIAHHSTQPIGRTVNRITNDVETINELFTSVLITIIRDIIMMCGAVAALILVHRTLGFITVTTLFPVFIVTAVFRHKSRTAFRNVRHWVSQVNTFLSEHLGGMTIVQMFAREKRTSDEFDEINGSLLKASLAEMKVFAIFRPIIDLLSSTSTAIMIFFGASLFLDNMISLGVLIAFVNLIREFYRPVMELSEQFTILQSALAGGERVFEMLDNEQRIPDDGTVKPDQPEGNIRFESVDFSYIPGEPIIRKLSLDIKAGETVAIVGYTGAGKTTITKLLTRLYDIDSGNIYLDDTELRDMPLQDLRNLVQPIQQDVFLFKDTIAENISLGRDAKGISIEQAAVLAQAAPFIDQLPHGYQTVIQEGGADLSTGQRQLLSFARALYHNPRVIILDEATANIDTETEQAIQKAMKTVLQGRTSIVIAHRLSTIQSADKIIVLSHGEIAEQGTHAELLRAGGMYMSLYKLQYKLQEQLPSSSPA
ncbi:ABC transporter ATP-binding protein [Spirochaeta dissipatitropha]